MKPRAVVWVTLVAGFVMWRFAVADDRPVVHVSSGGLSPARLEVHVGEVVRWRAATPGKLRIELGQHGAGAHEVIVRTDEIRGVFLKSGIHDYVGTLVGDGRRSFQGVVVVREESKGVLPPTCSSESSDRICFEP